MNLCVNMILALQDVKSLLIYDRAKLQVSYLHLISGGKGVECS